MATVDYTADAARPRRPPPIVINKLSTALGIKGIDLIIEDAYAYTDSVVVVAPATGVVATVFNKKKSGTKFVSTIRVTTTLAANPASNEADFTLSFTFAAGTNVPANYPTTVTEGYEIP